MARHRSHSIEFKRQVAQEFVAPAHGSYWGTKRTRSDVAFLVAIGGKADIALECAPRAGQVEVRELTG